MDKEPDRIINEAYANLLKAYLDKIRGLTGNYAERVKADFDAADKRTKRALLDGLDQVISNVEIALSASHSIDILVGSTPQSLIFDPDRAIQVRKSNSLSIQQLADSIGGISAATISRYENGTRYPTPQRPAVKRYLIWLMTNGYNEIQSAKQVQ